MIGFLTAIAMPPWLRTVLIYLAIAASVIFTILRIRSAAQKMGRISERLENAYELEKITKKARAVERENDRIPPSVVRDRLRDKWTVAGD